VLDGCLQNLFLHSLFNLLILHSGGLKVFSPIQCMSLDLIYVCVAFFLFFLFSVVCSLISALAVSPLSSSELFASMKQVKVCDICGDAGREDFLAICSRCADGAEHM